MPPKPAKSSAKADKKKEEAEQKAREEAEQAEREERERQEKEERERLEKEEKERQKAEEEARFLEETNRLNGMLESQTEELDKWKLEKWKTKQWEHYTSCSTLPDPSNEKSFNTYLSLCEETCINGKADIKATLGDIKDYLFLCSEVERLMYADGLPTQTNGDIEKYKQSIQRIHQLVQSKLDSATIEYMQVAELHVDTETYNLRVEGRIEEGLVYCLWGNVVKNPRLKSFSFLDHFKFTVDIPKPLLLADAAVRVVQLPFDPLSPQCQSYHCKRSPPSTSVSTQSKSSSEGSAPSNQEGNDVGGEGEPSEESADVASSGPAEEPSQQREEPSGTVDHVGVENGVSVVDQRQNKAQEGLDQSQTVSIGNGEGGEGGVGGVSGVSGDGCDGGEQVEEDEVNLRSFQPAGGPILFQLLEMPPQPKSINNWTIRKVVPSYLVPYKYPAEVPRPPPSATEEEKAAVPPPPTPGSNTWPPIPITMQLPDHYLFPEEPQLAQWDYERKVWKTTGIKDVQCNLDEKTVSFQTFYFHPLALMMDRYVNMPYLSWTMLPRGINHTLLTIEGGAVAITVDIKEHCSTLVAPTEESALTHILNKPMSARELKQALSSVGANFFPELDADKYVSVTPKRYLVENSVYQSMSLASCGFAFQWSKWNSEMSRGKVVLRAVQNIVTGGDIDQLQWSTYIGGRRNYKLTVTEESTEFSPAMADGCEKHPSLFSALEHDSSPQTKELFKKTSPMHNEAVKFWLTSVKMFTYS